MKREPGRWDEDEVLAACRAGDAAAWRALVERYQNMVFAICRRVAGADAEDAAQETFLHVFRQIKTFRGRRGAKFSTWLYRVAYNAALDTVRRRGPEATPLEEVAPVVASPAPEDNAPGDDYRRLVEAALAQIRPEYRQVLTLFYLLGKSHEEVAAVTGFPVGTVKSHLHRGREAVLRALKRMGVADALAKEL